MSFSLTVKNELARIKQEKEIAQLAELSALLRTTGGISIVGLNRLSFTVSTENSAIARRVFRLLKTCFGINAPIELSERKKGNLYRIHVPHERGANEILERIGIIEMEEDGLHLLDDVPDHLIAKEEAKRAYIRGAFLGCGSISNPQKAYHLEFATTAVDFSRELIRILDCYNIGAKLILRKNMQVVYIKDSLKITDMLTLMGAQGARTAMDRILVEKQVINDLNREVNCDTANIERTIQAAQRQIESIKYIKKKKGLSYLPENLQEIAKLRLKHFETPLGELGKMMKKPLGKSGVNHRLRKIEEIADQLREKLERS